jgi:hypothetical protein
MSSRYSSKRRGGITPRKVATKELRQRFLIVCEGEKTEPNYFRAFRVPREVITIKGVGANTVALVQRAIQLRNGGEYDQVWCVFDRDSFPAEQFNRALAMAQKENINVAYSNESFELWYLLHFHYYNTAITRADYIKKLTDLLGHKYEKNSDSIYDKLVNMQKTAVHNARRLLEEYDPPNPERDNPSTTVHLLVEQLLRFSL